MKKPRIDAFDPNAPSNLKSGLEHMPTIQRAQTPTTEEEQRPMSQPFDIPREPFPRPSVRTPVRIIKRHPFELYQDQIERLKRISLEDQFQGGKGSMSEMVREAIDDYIAKRQGGQE